MVINLEKWLSSLYFSKFEISEYVALTKLCILHNTFEFGENFYIQNNGLAMGNPLSPFLANLFMREFETHITSSFSWMYKSWNRYVDVFFCIVKEKHLDYSLNLLNIQDKNIHFTVEIEKSDYQPFLDLRIIKNNKKLKFGIFRKDTHSDNYIKANSYNPVTHKHAIINSLAYRLVNVPLDPVEYKKEYNCIIETAEKNGFKNTWVDKKKHSSKEIKKH